MSVRRDYLGTFPIVRELLAASEPGWGDASALEGMSIGALAAHTARSVTLVDKYLASPVADTNAVLDAAGYFTSIPGLGDDLETDVNVAVRGRADKDAAVGAGAVLASVDAAAAALGERLESEPPERTIAVLGGRVMLLDEYLVTRLIEIVVHGDDLAVSLGLEPPPFAHSTMDRVIECLVDIARRTHGRLAVIRALGRRERDLVEALRVL